MEDHVASHAAVDAAREVQGGIEAVVFLERCVDRGQRNFGFSKKTVEMFMIFNPHCSAIDNPDFLLAHGFVRR